MSSTNLSRRFFLRGKVSATVISAIRPPWSVAEHQFIDKCSRCDDCISACPEKIIIRGDGGYPEINFKLGECTFCSKCVKSCQFDVFDSYDSASRINTTDDVYSQAANAWNLDVSINSKCLSLNAVICRACGDNCEAEAIRFRLQTGGVSTPLIDSDKCTGCGACLSVCPADSISIRPEDPSHQ